MCVCVCVMCVLMYVFVFRVLCETVKDFVAKVGRAYEKNTENSEESETMAKKVRSDCLIKIHRCSVIGCRSILITGSEVVYD